MKEFTTQRLLIQTNLELTKNEILIKKEKNENILIQPSLIDLKPSKIENSGFKCCLANEPNIMVAHIAFIFQRGKTEISYGTEQEYQNRGFMTEALPACIKWIYENNYKDEIYALVNNNPYSERVLIKCGFKFDYQDKDGKWYIYSLLT